MPAYSKRVRQIVRQSSYFTRVSALYVRNKLDTKVFNFKRHLHVPVCLHVACWIVLLVLCSTIKPTEKPRVNTLRLSKPLWFSVAKFEQSSER